MTIHSQMCVSVAWQYSQMCVFEQAAAECGGLREESESVGQ